MNLWVNIKSSKVILKASLTVELLVLLSGGLYQGTCLKCSVCNMVFLK